MVVRSLRLFTPRMRKMWIPRSAGTFVYGMLSHVGRHSPTNPPLRSRGQHRADREMNLVLVGGYLLHLPNFFFDLTHDSGLACWACACAFCVVLFFCWHFVLSRPIQGPCMMSWTSQRLIRNQAYTGQSRRGVPSRTTCRKGGRAHYNQRRLYCMRQGPVPEISR